MFESDDFDQVLSQFDLPEDINNLNFTQEKDIQDKTITGTETIGNNTSVENFVKQPKIFTNDNKIVGNDTKIVPDEFKTDKDISPKHIKRKMIHSYFDHKSKRKFPGPAGLLTGGFEENKDATICQMELLSQDVDFSQNNLRGDLFESPLWVRLLDDLKDWKLRNVDTIKNIKQQTITGCLRRRKAQIVTAFVETVDRSVTDPLIIMRDTTGNIKGTLHRDAWSAFSSYIAAECCAFILSRPTILTTGSAFKKHYLNITLSNILAIYSSSVLNDEVENKQLPDGYTIVYEDDYTVIKTQNDVQIMGTNSILNSISDDSNDLLDGLDSIFSDDIF